MNDYHADVASDAWNTVENFLDEIVSHWRVDGEISTDLLNDYTNGDSYHHENHVDREYSLTEAAALLEQLSDHEEMDHGLWDGVEPRTAISIQAAFTYGNAVMSEWQDIVASLNEDLDEMRESMEDAFNQQRHIRNVEQAAREARVLDRALRAHRLPLPDDDDDEVLEEEVDQDEVEDEDEEERILNAGERLIRFSVWTHDHTIMQDDLFRAAMRGIWEGSTVEANAYADLLMEYGKDREAKQLKDIIAIGVSQ